MLSLKKKMTIDLISARLSKSQSQFDSVLNDFIRQNNNYNKINQKQQKGKTGTKSCS